MDRASRYLREWALDEIRLATSRVQGHAHKDSVPAARLGYELAMRRLISLLED